MELRAHMSSTDRLITLYTGLYSKKTVIIYRMHRDKAARVYTYEI